VSDPDPLAELPARVRAAVRARWPKAEVGELAPLPGGISSLTFATELGLPEGDRRVVVKMAPPGLEPVRNRDVLRQARLLDAVHGADGVRVPEVLARDGATPPFFVMAFVPGESYEPKWDQASAPPSPSTVAARTRAAAEMLARLQAIDVAAAGVAAGLGNEPVLSPAQELERWARLFATAGDDLRGDEARLRGALAASAPPAAPRPAIVHGDYRLGNLQFDGTRLAAIIDWEIWSVGDPRADLGWLMTFCDPVMERVAVRDPANLAAAAAMPTGAEVLETFRAAGGAAANLDALPWFVALAHYKLGATLSVLIKRSRRRPEPDPTLERAAETTPPMLARGVSLLD